MVKDHPLFKLAILLLTLIDRVVFYLLYCIKGKKALVRDFQGLGPEVKSVFVDDTIDPGFNPDKETKPLRHPSTVGKALASDPQYKSIPDMLQQAINKHGSKDFLGSRKIDKVEKVNEKVNIYHYRPLVWQTFDQVGARIQNIGTGIASLTGLNSGDKFAIFDNTNQEWFMAAQGALRFNMTLVTVYATLGEDALIGALNETEVTAILTNELSLSKFATRVCNEVKSLKYIIYTTERENAEEEIGKKYSKILAEKYNVKVVTVNEVEELGKQSQGKVQAKREPARDDLAIIMYTSGTTGKPKGVMITHGNVISACAGVRDTLQLDISTGLCHLAYLPLAHIFEFCAEHFIASLGGKIGYGNTRTLSDRTAKPQGDLTAVKPTFLIGVPRVYDTIKKGAADMLNEGAKTTGGIIKQALFEAAYEAKKQALAEKRDTPVFNALVFTAIRKNMGGAVSLIVSGGAALNKNTNEWLRICAGAPVVQGYGLTECCAALTLQSQLDEYKTGIVGGCAQCAEVKLVSVPEMGYFAKDQMGEICVRGPQVSLGYYKQEDKTREDYRAYGWFHTGDIGKRNEDGSLSVVDRKKNLVKLDTGEYIALEKLETIYGNSGFVSPNGICAYTDSHRSSVVALVIPNHKILAKYAAENNLNADNMSQLVQDPTVVKAVLRSFDEEAQKANLHRTEYITNVKLVLDEWTPENELLTPSMKLQRAKITKRYTNEIEELYAKK